MATKKSGLASGMDVLIPPVSATSAAPAPSRPPQKARKASSSTPSKANKKNKTRSATPSSGSDNRHTVWIYKAHWRRLELLKQQESERLRAEGKRVVVASLIDEAIEQYLKQHGA